MDVKLILNQILWDLNDIIIHEPETFGFWLGFMIIPLTNRPWLAGNPHAKWMVFMGKSSVNG